MDAEHVELINFNDQELTIDNLIELKKQGFVEETDEDFESMEKIISV